MSRSRKTLSTKGTKINRKLKMKVKSRKVAGEIGNKGTKINRNLKMAKIPTKVAGKMSNKSTKTKRKVDRDDPESLKEENTSTCILRLNDDCLQEIFTYLTESELLNVSRSNTRFKFACEEVFKRKFGGKPTAVSNIRGSRANVHNLKYSIIVLKHFGRVISELNITFKLEKIDSLLDAVAEYCGEKLLKLELHHVGVRVIKPSSSYESGLQKMMSFLSDLNTKFTSLCHLELKYDNKSKVCPYSDAIIQSIPSLTSFSTTETVGTQIFSEENLCNFIRSNRQLECLSFFVVENDFVNDTKHSWIITDKFIDCLAESLPMLKSVEINRAVTSFLPAVVNYPIRFKNLKKIAFYSYLEFQRADAGFMSFLSDSVETIRLSNFDFNIGRFVKNVSQFKNLKSLWLEYTMGLAATFLNDFNLARAVWTRYGIEQLILYNKNLTLIVLSLHPSEYGEDVLDLIYKGITEYTSEDGCRWNVFEGPMFSYVFIKESKERNIEHLHRIVSQF